MNSSERYVQPLSCTPLSRSAQSNEPPSRVIAVDWSGAGSGAARRIWLAEASQPGRLVRLEAGRDRAALVEHLLGETSRTPDRLVIGLDFAFSFPAWFVRTVLGLDSAPAVWRQVSVQGEAWLCDCQPPFWGRPGRRRPPTTAIEPAFRRTELALPSVGGIRPKSVFQIGGAGAVGTGSLRGLRLLDRLCQAGARVWPFTPAGWPLVIEIYPRLLTGAVCKSDPRARAELLERRYPALDAEHRAAGVASEDAFDAAVSALVMLEHGAELALSWLEPATDPDIRLEGRIWYPGWRGDTLSSEC